VSYLANALRLATAATIVGGVAVLGAATAAADPPSPDTNTLAGSLSKGYTLSNCSSDQPASGVLAVINCPQNPDPSGPAQATYLLFGNSDDTKGSFKTSIKDMTQANCGDTQSPTVWGQQQGTTAGQVACGTYQGIAEIIWSNTAKNVISMIRASNADVPALYQWWRVKG
jgi:hypothetical protein